jgi:hypothetical protein
MTSYSSQLFQRSSEIHGLKDTNLDEACRRVVPDGLEDGGKLFIQTDPLKEVHIVDMSVSKLSMAEGLVLLHLINGADGDVVAICSLRNIIMCKITTQPWGPVW